MAMLNGKKFLLLDPTQVKQTSDDFEYNKRINPLQNKEMQSLDKMMMDVINNPLTSVDEKVEKYNSILAQFQLANDKTTQIRPGSRIDTSHAQPNNDPLYNPLQGIPRQYANKALNLWSLLKEQKDLGVSTNGSISINGKPLDKTNITDMIYKAVNPKLKNMYIPGWNQFQQYLSQKNVPKSLLSNTVDVSVTVPSKAQRVPVIKHNTRTHMYHKFDSKGWEAHDKPTALQSNLQKITAPKHKGRSKPY